MIGEMIVKKYPRYIGIALVCLLVIGGAILWNKASIPGDKTSALAAEMSLKPMIFDTGGVDLKTSFQLSSSEEVDLKVLEKCLSIEPAFTYTLKSGEGNKEALVIPAQPLLANQVYKFSLALDEGKVHSWAFQTKGDFRVVSTLPGDRAGGVPLDTGIEVSFTHMDFSEMEGFVEINPQVEGRWEIHKKTAVFVPKQLKPATLYTVKVKKDLKVAGSDLQLTDDYIFQFETQADPANTPKYEMYLYEDTYEYTVDENPAVGLRLYSRGNNKKPDVKVMLFKYKGAEEYVKALKERNQVPEWAYFSRRHYQEDTVGLEKAMEFAAPIMDQNEGYLVFPEKLPAGFYLAQASVDEASLQIWLQVTNLGMYSVVAEDKTLVWVNDLLLGSPVQGAQIFSYEDGEKGVTDEQGVAILKSPAINSGSSYFIISQGDQKAVGCEASQGFYDRNWENNRKIREEYWKYLYLDRGLYKPDDTIFFWGLVKPRDSGIKELSRVKIELTKSGMREATTIISQELEVKNYSLSGSIKLPNLSPGYYSLVMKDGANSLREMGFEVQTYTKPAYQIGVTPSKKVLFAGEKVDINISAAFFEGTGAANMQLNYHLTGKSGSVTTDAEGKAVFTYTPQYNKNDSIIRHEGIYLNANLPESGEINAEATFVVLNTDLMLEAEGRINEGEGTVEVVLNHVNLEKYRQGEVEIWDNGAFKGEVVPNHQVTAKVYRDVWEQIEDGEYYDFINKKVQKRYFYNYHKEFVTEGSLITDAQGMGSFMFPTEEDKFYRVELSTLDSKGNLATREVYVQGTRYSREYEYQWYYLRSNKNTNKYKVGEEVHLTLNNNESPLPDRKNGFLFMDTRQGLKEHKLQDTGIYQSIFIKEFIPNYYVKGVYFDGRYYQDAGEYLVAFDENEKALDLEVTTDKAEYRPGEKVNLKVRVKDLKGQPAQAIVNLNLVDEALYTLRGQNANILYALYNDHLGSGIRRTLKTHKMPPMGGGAEHGGEGGSDRKDLRDAVFFTTLTTDNNGKAESSFTLPDNLTSWRLTSQAVNGELQAISTVKNIIVKLPFFVDITLNDRYLSGDQPVVYLRSFGNKLSSGEDVTYSVDVKREGNLVFSEKKTGKAFIRVDLALPALESGAYTFSVQGTSQANLSDALTLSFVVKDSFSEKREHDFYFLDNKTKIKGAADSPTTITFSDYERSQYLNILWRLSGENGNRVDQKLAVKLAGELMEQYFPGIKGGLAESTDSIMRYQTIKGGISLLPYSDPELELSAKSAGLSSVGFDKGFLKEYLQRIANDPRETRERGIIALYGLAALSEPVLQELSVVSRADDLTVKEKIYLILASLELGNREPAAELFRELLAKHSEELGPNLRINTGSDQDDILEATALAAVAAGDLGLDVKNRLSLYVLENSTTDILTNLDQLLFLKKVLPKMSSEVVGFSWSVNGKEENVKLEPRETKTLILTPEDLDTLKFNKIQGKIGVTSVYNTNSYASPSLPLDGVKITRAYSSEDNSKDGLKVNNLVKVNISYQWGDKAPDGMYQITDYLPAGLKVVQRPFNWGIINDYKIAYPVEVSGQKISFIVYGKKADSLSYYARVINAGQYQAESATIQHVQSGQIYYTTAREKVNIQ